jgi:hypothetical protein
LPVHTLNLSYCKNITNVSVLGNVYDLDLSYCNNITDVCAFENVHLPKLYLSSYENITDNSV